MKPGLVQIMQINLGNQSISSLALSPDFISDLLCFAATGQGLLVSRDGGETWQDALASLSLAEPIPIPAVCCVSRPKGGLLVLAGFNGGLLRSIDGGQTWQADPLVSPPPLVTALAAGPDGELYAGAAQDGVFITQDAGARWVRWNFGLLDWHIYSLAAPKRADGSRAILAGTETGVFYSENAGRAWRETDFPINAGPTLALTTSDDRGLVYAGTETGALFRSQDCGRTWKRMGGGKFAGEISALVQSGSSLWAASGAGLWASDDEGYSWREWNRQVRVEGAILSLALDAWYPAGPRLFAGSSDGTLYILPQGD